MTQNFRAGIFSLLAGAMLIAYPSCNSTKDQPSRHRFIHNNDGSDALLNRWFGGRPLTTADINKYVDMVAESSKGKTQVTTFMMCSGSDFFYYPSKYGRYFGDDDNGRMPYADSGLKKIWQLAGANYRNLLAEGTDVIEASLKRAKEHGLETFVSYRVNDLHFADSSSGCPATFPTFWIEHPQFWTGDSTQGWHSAQALDFSYPEVREYKLNVIREQLERYDMDGYELDFMRFIVLFKSGEGTQKAPLITDMVRKVRQMTDSMAKVRNHKILLAVRVPVRMDEALRKGLDVKQWANEGLVDFVTISAHWRGETQMPIAQFRKELGHPELPLYGTIDDGGYVPREFYSEGMFRGMASHILSQGGDGVYLFNYYFGDYNDCQANGQSLLNTAGQACRIRRPEMLNELGSLETMAGRNKIYCLSDGMSDSYRALQSAQLPAVVSNGRETWIDFPIGDDLQKQAPKESLLFLRTDRPGEFHLQINGTEITEQKPEAIEALDRNQGLVKTEQEYAFVIPAGVLHKGDNKIRLENKAHEEYFVLQRAEIALKYGDVTTNGYF